MSKAPPNGDYGRRFHIPSDRATRFDPFSCYEREGVSERQTKRNSPAPGERPRLPGEIKDWILFLLDDWKEKQPPEPDKGKTEKRRILKSSLWLFWPEVTNVVCIAEAGSPAGLGASSKYFCGAKTASVYTLALLAANALPEPPQKKVGRVFTLPVFHGAFSAPLLWLP